MGKEVEGLTSNNSPNHKENIMTKEKKAKPITKIALIDMLLKAKADNNKTAWLEQCNYNRLNRGWTVGALALELEETNNNG